ncbi:hypothetical protein BBF96_00135 [Anoxybacter fermentans]|uniref:Inner membrane protein n=1 Tax=Anoxybacter fermentans TaxID=1323375 RepID=A0A3Q9HNA7_9FIRM|nr:DUF1819 family protein [Anoxybacter fermentans]AZR71952.1 hypothetical protein BBF96_00135 [Anoxybacter fermentans]
MTKYKSTIKSMAFLYLELKKASGLYLQGLKVDEIKKKAVEENIFLLNTESRIKEIASTVIKRLQVLDEFLLWKITNGSLETSKQIALYAIMKTDRLFFEFMQEVYREKYLLMDYIINDKDFSVFFQRKSEQSDQVASWKDYTFYKLKQVYKRILVEAGFAKKNKKNLEIIKPIMEEEVIEHLKNKGDQIYLQAMLGEV